MKVQLLKFYRVCDLHVVHLVPWFFGSFGACEMVVCN